MAGGGGRIAIKLTDADADFSGVDVSRIFASGRSNTGTGYIEHLSSAGTVYLKTGAEAEKAGTLYLHNDTSDSNYYSAGNTNTTELVSLGYGGDDAADMKKVKLVVDGYARAAVNTDVAFASLDVADANSYVDFEGHVLTVKKAYINGTKLPAGEYTIPAADDNGVGVHATYSALYNSSTTAATLLIRPDGLRLSLR